MRHAVIGLIMLLASGIVNGTPASEKAGASEAPKRRLLVIATAHLDTQWRWTIQQTIDEYIPETFRVNAAYLDQYRHYVFSFEGAFRYMLLKEYYPDYYVRLKTYIADGRWHVAGSWVDAVDVNVPSSESLIRQALYGNGFFRKEFGKTSRDVLLPDCFGFGYALPSIAAHCGLASFSSQKLTWGSSVGVPFDIGVWEGVDGSSLIAALKPGDYVSKVRSDLSRDSLCVAAVEKQGEVSGLYAGFKYYGTGDTGGGPDSLSVAWVQKSVESDGPLTVRTAGSDDLASLVTPEERAKLPRYKGELLMTRHGVGCYTSQAAMKRWNRKNELLADAAERASMIAWLLNGAEYPREQLRTAWIRFLWHQFHDDITGTSIPQAYEFSWNDEILSANQFASTLESAVEVTARALDTRVKGVPLVVFNPLSIEREDIVEAAVLFDGKIPAAVRVFGPDGSQVPSQITSKGTDGLGIVFLAKVPSVGYAVYDVRPSDKPCAMKTGLSVTASTVENDYYLVRLDENGDVASVTDKVLGRELLSAPARLQLLYDHPDRWAAWEIDYDEIMPPPRAFVGGPAKMRIVESGPARVVLEVTRTHGASTFRQTIRLAAGSGGAGGRVEIANVIDWYERETLLKAAFALSPADSHVTYDLGLGTIARGVNRPALYEVPGHWWADMTAPGGDYGVAILNDCKYGWDHPEAGTLRLTLIHTPGVPETWEWIGDQRSQDNGRHQFVYAMQGHRGDWRDGGVQWQAACLNQPLRAFQASEHRGALGKSYSLLAVKTAPSTLAPRGGVALPSVAAHAVKLAEESDEVVVRLQELRGEPAEVRVSFSVPIVRAREVNGAEMTFRNDREEPLGDARTEDGVLPVSLTPYQPKAFAVTLASTRRKSLAPPSTQTVTLPFDLDGVSLDSNRRDGDFDGEGNTLSGDILPDTLMWNGIPFIFGPTSAGANNVVACRGQTVNLPREKYNRLYVLASAVGGPAKGTFSLGESSTEIWVQDYAMPIAQWNNRLATGEFKDDPASIAPAYINRAPVAWAGTHRHTPEGKNEAYRFTYLYLIELPVPPHATALTLPDNGRIRVMAATLAATGDKAARTAAPLYDVADATVTKIQAQRRLFLDRMDFTVSTPNPGADIHYTLDGSDPTPASPRYTGPVTLTQSTVVKSRAFLEGADDGYVTRVEFTRVVPHEAVVVDHTSPGLRCAYYEGEWSDLPDFSAMTASREFVSISVAIPEFARAERFGLAFTGYVLVEREGLYDFSLTSDDGSALYVADTLVIDNGGLHGEQTAGGTIALEAGLHPIVAYMFQRTGGKSLGLTVEGPGLEGKSSAARMLFHGPEKRGQ